MPDLTGRRLSELFDPAVGVTAPEALPLDLPLHDLAGAILGEPCYRMMGAAGPTALPAATPGARSRRHGMRSCTP